MTDVVLDDGLLRSKPPRPLLQIGREKVFIAIGVLGLLITLSIILRGEPHKPKPAEGANQLGQPGYNVTTLPSSYEDLPSPTPVAQQKVEIMERDDVASKLDALLAKLAEEKLRRGEAAQKASINFQHLTIPNESSLSLTSSSRGDSSPSPLAETLNGRDDANRQDEKTRFLEQKREDEVTLGARLIKQRSPYQLIAGTLIPGLLLSALNSDLPGQILGQVSQSVYDTTTGSFLLIPQGTKVIGQYDSRVVYGQERLLIVWTRLILPNGKSLSLEGMPGVDLSGTSGLSDQVNNHWGRLLTGVVFSSLLSAGAQIAEGRNYSTVDPSYGELATQGIAKNANQVGQELTRRNLNVQPTLQIRPGFRFNVFVHKDITLEPYKES